MNDGKISGRNHEWVQDALTVTVDIFCRMGMKDNLEKCKVMVFTTRFIWGEWGDSSYKWRATGEGATLRERKKTRVSCTVYGVKV